MNIIKKLGGYIMNLISQFNIKAIGGANIETSGEMMKYIDLWASIAQGRAAWNKEAPACGIPAAIAGALADPVDEEIKVTAEAPELDKVIKDLDEKSSELVYNLVQYGASIIRPIYSNGIKFEIIRLGNYYPTSYDFDGTLTGAVILKKLTEGDKEFLLTEKHEYKNRNHAVNLSLYEVKGGKSLRAVPLTACTITAELTPSYTWENVDRPFIVEVRNRKTNNIDGSATPCAIYSGYENLIEDADRQYWRMNWEQEGGEMHLFADADLFLRNGKDDDHPALSKKVARLIVKTDGGGVAEEKIHTHAPGLRTSQQLEAFNAILRQIETACNIGKGTLSNLEAVAQTATQYSGGKKALYSAVDTIESELEAKYKDLGYIFAYILGAMENKRISDKIVVLFNDASRKDPAQMKQQALQEVNAGIMSKEEYRILFYGEDEATAAAKVTPSETGGFVL